MSRGRSSGPRQTKIWRALAALTCVGLFSIAIESPAASAAGEPEKRVAGGYYPNATFAPWTTYIESNQGACSASLIAPKRVLTAAHCVVGDTNPRTWIARVGARNYANSSDGETHKVSGIAIHPKVYLPDSGAHTYHAFYDVAVIFLKRRSHVTPAPIGSGSDWGSYGVAMGWGHINYHGNPTVNTSHVKAINLSLGSDSDCSYWVNSGGTQHYYPTIHVCAYDQQGDDCITHGDSGGPLMVYSGGRWKLIGVTSFFPAQQSWGPCGTLSMAGYAWVAGPTLRSWPRHVSNPTCRPAKKRLRKAKRAWRNGLISSRPVRKAKRKVRQACTG